MTTAITDATAWDTASLVSSASVLCSGGGTSLVNVLAKRRPRALVISAVRPVTNIFWVLYFTLLPSIGVLYAAFIPKAGRGKLVHSLCISENLSSPLNKEEASCFSRACLAQRSCPSRDRLCSSLERSPDRPMAMPTAPAVIAAATPQITPIKTPRATSPVHHHRPRLTTNDTTKNTTVDNITMAAILERILHPIVCVRLCDYASVMSPTLFAAERSLRDNRSAAMLLGEGLAQLLLLLLGQVGRDD